jgi:hypothetical protein
LGLVAAAADVVGEADLGPLPRNPHRCPQSRWCCLSRHYRSRSAPEREPRMLLQSWSNDARRLLDHERHRTWREPRVTLVPGPGRYVPYDAIPEQVVIAR